jgi:predicted transposase YbfD/YdcC
VSEDKRAGLVGYFEDLPDPRVVGRTDHDLLDIVILALCAVMSGAEGWDDIEAWGCEREAWLRRFLRLRNGIPGHDTIRRVFEALAPAELEKRFAGWVSSVCPALAGRVIAIDGKALRGSGSLRRGSRALHLVSAYATEYGLTLGQRACAEKSNEITAIQELLPVLALEGAVVTIDAIGCLSAIAQQITEAKGHYVLAVKDNQPQLAEALRDFFVTLNRPGYPQRAASTLETLDKGHGRLEQRRCVAVGELDWLDTLGLRSRWPGLASVACIESHRHIGEKCETDTRYLISSLPAQAGPILHAVRTHWGVENALHWCLDVTFGEDASAIRLRNAAHNFSFLRRLALNLFRADTSRKISLARKRKTAGWNPDYLAQVLGLPAI